MQQIVEALDGEVGFEGVDLAAEGVAANSDVDGAQSVLTRPAVDDLGGQQDHSGTGSEGGHTGAQPCSQRF
jgi:hypothetical protein